VLLRGVGADGTEHLGDSHDRIDIILQMWGDPDLGVLLVWTKWGGGHQQAYTSKGDLTRLHEYTRTLHDDPLPIGLFISFEQAWRAVKEFLETDGALPKSIAWIASQDLPPDTFPDQYEFRIREEGRRTS
jgi:Immunity protein Imm1